MDQEHHASESDLEQQIDTLREQVETNRQSIDALRTSAEANHLRADASEARTAQDRHRIDDLEERVDMDRLMILELQTEGLLKKDQVENLQLALQTSRKIGAAIGIIMATRLVSESEAFAILRVTSQQKNRKIRELADQLVLTGDVSVLTGAT